MIRPTRCGIAVLVLGGLASAAALADEPDGLRVIAGIGGVRKTGAWTPLVVTAPPGELAVGEPIRVAVEDPDGQFVRSPPVVVAPDAAGTPSARFRVRFGRPAGHVRIERGAAVAEQRLGEAIRSTDRVIIVYGDLPAVARAARLVDRERGGTTRIVPGIPETSAGPPLHPESDAPRDYDAADAIVVCGRAAAALPADVVAGIDGWVRSGGRLVVVAGASAAEAPAIAGWLPGRFSRVMQVRQVGPLEAFARASGLSQAVANTGLAVPVFDDRESRGGVVDVALPAAPLVVRRPLGLGVVAWVGIDLDVQPLRDWHGSESILVALLTGGASAENPQLPAAAPVDLAGQLRAALDSCAGGAAGRPRRPVPFEVIAGIGLLYVCCLYPLDWWLASRFGQRAWLPWLSLPALATVFGGAAWAATNWWSPGGRPEATCAGIIDVDAATGFVRGAAWTAVSAAGNAAIDLAVAPPADAAGIDGAVSWFADAGAGFGGMDAAVSHPSLAAADYGYADTLRAFAGVPIAARSSRLFEAEWTGRLEGGVVESSLRRTPEGTLSGGLTHRLPERLEGCRILHAGWLYDVGTLGPGDRYDTAAGRGPRSLASAITRRAASLDRDRAVRWDPASIDVPRILEMAGFHAAVGGVGYTAFDLGRLRRLDLSPLLSLDRAVLVGALPVSRSDTGWRLRIDGTEQVAVAATPTLCRIVIPLATEAAP